MGEKTSSTEITDNPIKIINTFCLWSDLLGYGKAFYDSGWDLNNELAYKNLERIKHLETCLHRVSSIHEKMLSLNDGFIRVLDYSVMTILEVLLWLEIALEDFYITNTQDVLNGYYGLRGILTCGQRAEYTKEGLKLGDCTQTTEERRKILNRVNLIYSPHEFQMNTAFSKAYIIEVSGRKKGVVGNNLYIDQAFIKQIIKLINSAVKEKMLLVNEIKDDIINLDENTYIKFNAQYISSNDNNELIVQATQNDGIPYDYLRIKFSNNIVNYRNRKCKINTKLIVAKEVWSIREPDFTFKLYD